MERLPWVILRLSLHHMIIPWAIPPILYHLTSMILDGELVFMGLLLDRGSMNPLTPWVEIMFDILFFFSHSSSCRAKQLPQI